MRILLLFICATAFAQSPPTPTIDTNLAEVGSVNVAWNAVTETYDPVAWYGVYWGTTSNRLSSTVIVSVDETNTAAPLFAYGTNWLAVTSIDPLLIESTNSPAISLNFVTQPITNVVTVTLLGSTNAADFYFVQTLFTLTNPPNTFYKLAITNQTQ